jgi:pimeloyl-ACP methyl ester carboxylesterase
MIPVRQTLSKPDIQLAYLEWDQGREPLLLLHGLGDHALVWSSLGNHLAADYHIVAPDMRGHGDSSKPDQDYTFESAIADLEALMDHLGWSTAHVVSHSWTGKLAAIWARKNPARLRSMTLVDPIFIWQIPKFWKITLPLLYRLLPFLKSMGPFPSYELAEKQGRQLSQYQAWSPLQQEIFHRGIEQKPDGSWGSKFTVAARDGIFAAVMEAPGFVTPVNTPTLFVQPKKGVNRQDWQIKPYKTYLQNLRCCQVPGNHWPFLTHPQEFNQIIAAFLRENS